jgi:hypothetical protein
MMVGHTDVGLELKESIKELQLLVSAYQSGIIAEKK